MKNKFFRRLALKLIKRLIRLLLESLVVSLLLYLILELVKPEPQVGVVKGNVTYGDAAMIEGVTMTLVKEGATVASVLTNAAGAFEFDPVAIGAYTLDAHKDVPEGFLSASMEVEVTGEGVQVTDLPLVKSHLWCMPGHGNH